MRARFLATLRAERRLGFIHVPKTAGSTLVEHYRGRLPAHCHFFYSEEHKRRLPEFDPLAAGLDLPLLFGGHLGLAFWAPRIDGRVALLSFVREPCERLLSYYRFSRVTRTRNPTSEAARSRDFAGFLDFLAERRPRILRNQQCRFLADDPQVESALDIRFEQVLAGLEGRPLMLAPSEHCSALIAELANGLGLEAQAVRDVKVSAGASDPVLDAALRERVLDYNREDERLYRFALSRLASGE